MRECPFINVFQVSQSYFLRKAVKSGDHHFIEIMCCPGGCIGGGGQPRKTTHDTKESRMEGIYTIDQNMPLRKSHDNPAVKKLYEEFLEKPLGHKSHELLHTHYTPRKK